MLQKYKKLCYNTNTYKTDGLFWVKTDFKEGILLNLLKESYEHEKEIIKFRFNGCNA